MIFAEKMRTLLRRRGFSARALATELKLSNSTIAGWLKSARPQPSQARLLAEFFRVPVDDLLDDSKELPMPVYLQEIREDRSKAEEAYPGNPEAQMHAADWLEDQRAKKRGAERLRKVIAELASIAYDLDSSDGRLHEIFLQLRDGKAPQK